MSKPIHIVLLIQETIFRKAISLLLRQGGLEVLDDFSNVNPLISKLQFSYQSVDLLLMDKSFFATLESEQLLSLYHIYPHLQICVIVPDGISQFEINKLFHKGASFLLNGSLSPEQFIVSLRTTYEKKIQSFHKNLPLRPSQPFGLYSFDENESISLSNREIEIIRLSCLEYNSKEIASLLYISKRTVDQHRLRIMERFGKKNFIGVVLYAVKHNILNVNEI